MGENNRMQTASAITILSDNVFFPGNVDLNSIALSYHICVDNMAHRTHDGVI